jgi:hypothetical protein
LNSSNENNEGKSDPSLKVIDEDLDLDLLDLIPVFSSFQTLPEPSFEDREHRFHEISPVIAESIKGTCELSAVPAMDRFPLSVSDGNHRLRLEPMPDQPVEIFGIIPFIQDVIRRLAH